MIYHTSNNVTYNLMILNDKKKLQKKNSLKISVSISEMNHFYNVINEIWIINSPKTESTSSSCISSFLNIKLPIFNLLEGSKWNDFQMEDQLHECLKIGRPKL
jgi:hypothetical protein